MTTNESCPAGTQDAGKAQACAGCPNQSICASSTPQKDTSSLDIANRLSQVKHKLLVLSGKGGVGKSTFSSNLAWFLSNQSETEVGLLDVDVCGPSIPKMMGLEGETVHSSNSGWSPVYVRDNLAVMSIGFMMQDPDQAVIWRGPKKNGLLSFKNSFCRTD